MRNFFKGTDDNLLIIFKGGGGRFDPYFSPSEMINTKLIVDGLSFFYTISKIKIKEDGIFLNWDLPAFFQGNYIFPASQAATVFKKIVDTVFIFM